VSVSKEACPLGLAPTSSTTASLAMGDAMAIALLEVSGFSAEDFARSHPGGRLGRRLLLHIGDLMHRDDQIPLVPGDVLVSDALVEMTRKGLGMTAVVDGDGRVEGIFTDGDVRRVLDHKIDVHASRVGEVMTRDCKKVPPDMVAAEALHVMQTQKISALLVVDQDNRLIGALNMHDMLRAGVL